MAETATQDSPVPVVPASVTLDWDKLAKALNIGSAEEAKERAYQIAEFVARVENDSNSKLILKTGNEQLALTLNR
jgi:hypothetical protein